jgi:hypothetical protein
VCFLGKAGWFNIVEEKDVDELLEFCDDDMSK